MTLSFPGLGLEFTLNRIAFSVGPFHVHWYGLIIAVGFLLAMLLLVRRSRTFGLDPDRSFDIALLSVAVGLVGARAYYVVFNWQEFAGNPAKIIRVWDGGLAIYGGLIFGFITAMLLCRHWKVPVLPLLDAAAIPVLLAQGIGRWGNFVNIEAFGSNTDLPWGMTSPTITNYLTNRIEQEAYLAEGILIDPTAPVHPCFFYEFLWCMLGVLLLSLYVRRRKFDGEVFFMYIGWYGLGRFFIEGLRTDSLMIGHYRVSQLVAAGCVIASLLLILWRRRKIRNRSEEEGPYLLYAETEASKERLAEVDRKLEEEKLRRRAKKLKVDVETLREQEAGSAVPEEASETESSEDDGDAASTDAEEDEAAVDAGSDAAEEEDAEDDKEREKAAAEPAVTESLPETETVSEQLQEPEEDSEKHTDA